MKEKRERKEVKNPLMKNAKEIISKHVEEICYDTSTKQF